ncbi:hypothetical protein [Tenacibaculum phage PTm5]|uniref:Uncharacterized protein n=1 Tax=Tenacibaculum phage PTm5 TaxID=2547426 RepID=A0A5S9HXW0_9CAUD|nr:hypothetical protein [Tenacibaculum phage PTm5]
MVNEALKQSLYNQVVQIMNKEWSITNNGVQKQFEKFVVHLEKIMTHPRIINQFTLSLQKFKKRYWYRN